jgi:hypothetical protein
VSGEGWVVATGQVAARQAVVVPHTAALVQRLFIPGHFPTLNEVIEAAKGAGGKGFRYAAMKRQWGELVWALAKAAKIRPVRRARFGFLWIEKDKRRDPDNVAAFKKAIFDGLVTAKVIPGDGWAAVAGWSDDFIVNPKRHGVEVTIQEEP